MRNAALQFGWLFPFTATDLRLNANVPTGEDYSDQCRQKCRRSKPFHRIYVPQPSEKYDLNVLGDPVDFGVNLMPD